MIHVYLRITIVSAALSYSCCAKFYSNELEFTWTAVIACPQWTKQYCDAFLLLPWNAAGITKIVCVWIYNFSVARSVCLDPLSSRCVRRACRVMARSYSLISWAGSRSSANIRVIVRSWGKTPTILAALPLPLPKHTHSHVHASSIWHWFIFVYPYVSNLSNCSVSLHSVYHDDISHTGLLSPVCSTEQ